MKLFTVQFQFKLFFLKTAKNVSNKRYYCSKYELLDRMVQEFMITRLMKFVHFTFLSKIFRHMWITNEWYTCSGKFHKKSFDKRNFQEFLPLGLFVARCLSKAILKLILGVKMCYNEFYAAIRRIGAFDMMFTTPILMLKDKATP